MTDKASPQFIKDMKLRVLFYINLVVLGVIWVVSGLSSIINISESRELIAMIGLKGSVGDAFIYSAAIGDILLGLLLWVPQIRQRIIFVQITVMVTYTIIITAFAPVFWLHPFAPIVKNLAMLMMSLYLLAENRE